MNRRRLMAAVALAAAVGLGATACGGATSSTSSGAGFNAGIGKVANPSDQKGGTLRFANSSDWDSLDLADTYFAYSWDFLRNYARPLVTFNAAPGQQGAQLVPDLAQSLGVPSDNNMTWTYKLRSGIKFEDGTPVTSKDVKYAVERSLDKSVFPDGPTYFNDLLDLQGYTSPYNDPSPDKLGLKAIDTPDDQTVVFHLKQPFSEFDYIAQLPATAPVPQAKDTGSQYKQHVVSTGPYMFQNYQPGKQFTMVRNPNWDPKTDPFRKALPDNIQVDLNVNADDIDNRLLSGDLDVSIEGTGVGSAAQGRVLADQSLKANSDSAPQARLWFTSINGDVAPLDNIHCRKAIEYAADRSGYQRAYGGPTTGGDVATNLMPPVITGAQQFDPYPLGPGNQGDVAKAKDELAQCGQPNGFSTSISYRAERPKEKATAESLQQSLGRVGIQLTPKPYPSSDYTKLYAGKPDFAKANGLGLEIFGWGADWPDGYGFLSQLVDSRTIKSAGNSNFSVKDPAVDQLIDQAVNTADPTARNQVWTNVDKKVMDDAFILPGIWAKGLLYRPPNLTNVFSNDAYQMYDYTALGTTRK